MFRSPENVFLSFGKTLEKPFGPSGSTGSRWACSGTESTTNLLRQCQQGPRDSKRSPLEPQAVYLPYVFIPCSKVFRDYVWKVESIRNLHRHERIACLAPLFEAILHNFVTLFYTTAQPRPQDGQKPTNDVQGAPKRGHCGRTGPPGGGQLPWGRPRASKLCLGPVPRLYIYIYILNAHLPIRLYVFALLATSPVTI